MLLLWINSKILKSDHFTNSDHTILVLLGETIALFDEPNHLLRCIGFSGNTIISGDFGGCLHLWEIEVKPGGNAVRKRKYHYVQSHKSHIVCLQVSARRIVSGSRDKTVLIQDFWASVRKKRSLWYVSEINILYPLIKEKSFKLLFFRVLVYLDSKGLRRVILG